MRATLIVNPNATAIRRGAIAMVERAVAEHATLTVVPTSARGHATDLARQAREDGYDTVVAFGGDGTINEVVQGLLGDPDNPPAGPIPALAPVPGGYGNTFARNLGFPMAVRGAARRLSEALGEKRRREIGLGFARAESALTAAGDHFRWVCFAAGLGLDAEIIRSIELARNGGRKINGPLYVGTTARQALHGFDRRHPRLIVREPGGPPGRRAFMTVIQNTSPYAYVNRWHMTLAPRASFDTGLDLFALYEMSTRAVVRNMVRASSGRLGNPDGVLHAGVVVNHDVDRIRIESTSRVSLQIDGEGIGIVDAIECRSVPKAVAVYC